MRAPSLLGRSPSAARSTPAFTSSSLNLIIAVINASLGISPASDAFVALRITMKRMCLLRCHDRGVPGLHDYVDCALSESTPAYDYFQRGAARTAPAPGNNNGHRPPRRLPSR